MRRMPSQPQTPSRRENPPPPRRPRLPQRLPHPRAHQRPPHPRIVPCPPDWEPHRHGDRILPAAAGRGGVAPPCRVSLLAPNPPPHPTLRAPHDPTLPRRQPRQVIPARPTLLLRQPRVPVPLRRTPRATHTPRLRIRLHPRQIPPARGAQVMPQRRPSDLGPGVSEAGPPKHHDHPELPHDAGGERVLVPPPRLAASDLPDAHQHQQHRKCRYRQPPRPFPPLQLAPRRQDPPPYLRPLVTQRPAHPRIHHTASNARIVSRSPVGPEHAHGYPDAA